METNRKATSALLEDPESSGEPSAQPQSGTVLRSEVATQLDDEPTKKFPQDFARAVLLEHLREFCAAWPDQPHPALHGETPRKIALTATGQLQLAALIGEMEQQAQGTPIADAWDFDRLRFELGLSSAPPSGFSATKAR